MRKFTKYPQGYVKASVGSNSDRFEIVVWDIYSYDEICDAIDGQGLSSTVEAAGSENFYINGPYDELYDVIEILNDFAVDYKEL